MPEEKVEMIRWRAKEELEKIPDELKKKVHFDKLAETLETMFKKYPEARLTIYGIVDDVVDMMSTAEKCDLPALGMFTLGHGYSVRLACNDFWKARGDIYSLEDCSILLDTAFDFTIKLFEHVGEKCRLREK